MIFGFKNSLNGWKLAGSHKKRFSGINEWEERGDYSCVQGEVEYSSEQSSHSMSRNFLNNIKFKRCCTEINNFKYDVKA